MPVVFYHSVIHICYIIILLNKFRSDKFHPDKWITSKGTSEYSISGHKFLSQIKSLK